MSSISQDENSPQDDLPQTLDPAILAELLRDTLTIVDREDDCILLQKYGFHATWLEPGDHLTTHQLDGVKRIVALQRPGSDGEPLGLQVRDEIDILKWKGEFLRSPIPDPVFDLAILERETGGDAILFASFIADVSARGVRETFEDAKEAASDETSDYLDPYGLCRKFSCGDDVSGVDVVGGVIRRLMRRTVRPQ
jgi:hypothetical protein